MFYQPDPRAQEIGELLVTDTSQRLVKAGLTNEHFSLTLLLHPPGEARCGVKPGGFSYRGNVAFYPASVVKLFVVVAAQVAIDEGRLTPHDELSRAMRDMIRWSSNAGTNYVIDLLSGTTGDTLLDEAEMRKWVDARSQVNRYYQSLEPQLCAPINVSQKLMDDDRYGREKVFVQWLGSNNHNRLTSDAAAWLLAEIVCGDLLPASSAQTLTDFLYRPLEPQFIEIQTAQVNGFLGAGLPAGSQLWSKAGRTAWTGDPLASYRRHDAAHVRLPGGQRFTLVVFTQGREVTLTDDFLPRIGKLASERVAALRS